RLACGPFGIELRGFVDTVELIKNRAERTVRLGVVGLEVDCGAKALDGAVDIIRIAQANTEVVAAFRLRRCELDCPPIGIQRLVRPRSCDEHAAESVPDFRIAWHELERARDMCYCRRVVTLVEPDQPEVVQRLRLIRSRAQDLAISRLGLDQA